MSANAEGDTSSDEPAERTITVIGFGPRLVATLIDGALVVILTLVLSVVVSVVPLLIGWLISIPVTAVILVASVIFSVVYYAGAWTKSGQTAGNLVMGIKVIGKDGRPITWWRALLRYIGYIVNTLLLSLGFVWIAFDRKRQGLHDKMAGTYVIRDTDKFSDSDAVRFAPSDPERSWIWPVVWVVVAIVAPAALLGGVWVLGPFVSRAVINIFGLGG